MSWTDAAVSAWLESDEGRAAITEALRKTREANRRARESRRVDWRELDVPFDAAWRVHGR